MSRGDEILSQNDIAPDFSLPSDTGQTISLKDFHGQFVILYFYPKDHTSGCTAQACQFRDMLTDFHRYQAIVLGISKDSLQSHSKFHTTHQLNFSLLSDETGEICQKYNVWVEKSMYGRKYFGIERSTFLIDPAGRIRHVWRKVKVPGHSEEILKILKSQQV